MRVFLKLYLPLTLLIINLSSCADLLSDSLETIDYRSFGFYLDVVDSESSIDKGDTLWIEQIIPDEAIDATFNKQESIENATVDMNFSLSMLYADDDSSRFINNNFSVIVEQGNLELTNVFDYEDAVAFQLLLQYGLPFPDKKVRIGIIPHHGGVFVLEASGSIFYGPDRTDATDYSLNSNLVGEITYIFSGEEFNKDLYYEIPIEERTAFSGFFNTINLDSGLYYFIEVE